MNKHEPLAIQVRPKCLKDVIGQNHLLNQFGVIPRMIAKKEIFSSIFYGKPGIGKTTLAIVVANELNVPYQIFNAANDNKDKLVEILNLANLSSNYILIVEEIHRLNRDRQDILLDSLEKGKIKLFGTTTENPFFVLNPAIRSRCQIFQLKPLTTEETFEGLKNIIQKLQIKNISTEILNLIANKTQGDLRAAINLIDLLTKLYPNEIIDTNILQNVLVESYVTNSHYDDEFHNLKSALHKSIRGSDVDASLHYLGRMIVSEDLVSISRRLIMVAYEDIGLANPNLCMRVYIGIQAAKEVGFPEASTILSNLVIEMALSPKSNSSAIAIHKVLTDIATGNVFSIPKHLHDNHYKSSTKLGVVGYKYPHDYPNAWVEQQYLPDELNGKVYYEPVEHSQNEIKLNSWRKKLDRYKEDY
ncbi:replication-associated recombination protein A [Mycoplasmoides alvi]|uniref:replication-associated recombination protein A n=1 Tax=Mycoplasmoides alvi TaxID=78580 RepID=UPI00051BF751|nr:replication-associated recombination protein A [Mycoplasmoides alvi]